jgi:hypothetical protein
MKLLVKTPGVKITYDKYNKISDNYSLYTDEVY